MSGWGVGEVTKPWCGEERVFQIDGAEARHGGVKPCNGSGNEQRLRDWQLWSSLVRMWRRREQRGNCEGKKSVN